ncbi:MAG: hypothetical protein WC414_03180 [Patescibacteria group bacterium]
MKNQMFFEKNKVEKIIILNYVIIAFVAVIALASLCFIYHNIYKTIDTGKNHVLVKINPDFEPIDFDLYEKTLTAWQNKIKKDKIYIKMDPFYQTVVSTTTIFEENKLSTEADLAIKELVEETKTQNNSLLSEPSEKKDQIEISL